MGKELEKMINAGHLEKVNSVDDDCFLSPVVITLKNDNSVKMELDSRKLNNNCIKGRAHMQNMEKSLNQISVEITRDRTVQLFIPKIDLDYVYRQKNHRKELADNAYSQSPEQNSADITMSKRGFTGWPRYPQNFKKTYSEH